MKEEEERQTRGGTSVTLKSVFTLKKKNFFSVRESSSRSAPRKLSMDRIPGDQSPLSLLDSALRPLGKKSIFLLGPQSSHE